MFQLTQNKTYCNSGNIFSRVLLVAKNLKNKNLIIFDSSEELRIFNKIWNYFGYTPIYILEDSKDLLGFIVSHNGVFLANKDILTLSEIREYDISNNSIRLKLGENQDIDELIKKLIDYGYKHSPSLSHSGTYHKMGDSLDIRDFFEEKIYKISFFGDEVDEIVFKTNIDKIDWQKAGILNISNLNFTNSQSKKSILDNLDIFSYNNEFSSSCPPDKVELKGFKKNELYEKLSEINPPTPLIRGAYETSLIRGSGNKNSIKVVGENNIKLIDFSNSLEMINSSKGQFQTLLIGLDFFDGLEKLQKLNLIILSETPSDNYIDLGVKGLEIESLEKLTETLKNKENKIKIYTKNVKTITNFIEYNDISGDIEIIETSPSMRYLESFEIKNESFINNFYNNEFSSSRPPDKGELKGVKKNEFELNQDGINPPTPLVRGAYEVDFIRGAGKEDFQLRHNKDSWSSQEGQEEEFQNNSILNSQFSILYICDDILSAIFVKKRSRKSISKNVDLLLEIKPNDYIVHIDHGVGIFRSITIKELSGIKREYLEIEYSNNDKLFVPISELHRVSKYIGEENPKLTRLSSTEWQKTLKKVGEEIEKVAEELLEIYAKRNITSGYSFVPFIQKEAEFKNNFKFIHTIDQSNSIHDILDDMEKSKPMDRLLVGDVGFGKTEVACNAIYRCLLNNKQAAFISPLVILAYEHYDTVIKRFAGLGYKIEIVTRVEKPSKVERILKDLANGEIDIIIGTHRLLSEDVRFKNLGLLIIDEEHRFGVIDKEKITKLKEKIDILSLSATPIPRSLNFALNGIKDISIISTPPPLKKPIKTFTLRWSDEAIVEAIKKEFERDGQVIFIHNRVATIEATKNYLQRLIGPKAKIIITHGQMNGVEVEDRILDFKNGKYNILLSTTVIENGVNFLNANTIIIDEADKFGLSQLHQLRGRVGRKDIEGFCYLSYRNENLADDAKKRLVTIVNNTHLGAGFEIALRDLEIRGAGDILGIKQSGKSKETGISLYLKLLEEKIEELKTGNKPKNNLATIELAISFYISDDFFSSEADKIHFFRNIESIETLEDLEFSHETFIKGNDNLPEEIENLFLIMKTRIILSEFGVISLKKVGLSYIFEFDKNTAVEKIREFLDKFDKTQDFILITVHKIKVEAKIWGNDKEFLESLVN